MMNDMEVRLGAVLHLNLQLFDGATGLHVLVHVMDENGVELPESPAVMPHTMFGRYGNDSFRMPYTREVKAVYKVFLDAGHTVISPIHSDAIDVFELEDDGAVTADLSGSIEDSGLSGIVDGLVDLGGNVFGDILLPGIIEDSTLNGSLEENEISSQVIGEEELAGKTDC